MNINDAIAVLDNAVLDPTQGLPTEVFQFISRLTPLVNVDLLIKDQQNRTLLSWRDDEYAGKGWHIPGGIVRYKESFTDRINKTAEEEIGSPIKFNPTPIAFNEIESKNTTRGHFISFLFNCYLEANSTPLNPSLSSSDPGYLAWHTTCPPNLIKSHMIYTNYL